MSAPLNPRTVVVAPPPTPNGDLHVGHLAGPYLAADVFARFERLCGIEVFSAISTDENQSYVVTTAERLNRDPRELAAESHEQVRRTLQMCNIEFDLVGRPDDAYASFARQYLETLWDAGIFEERSVDVMIDGVSGRQLTESYVGGRCPVCFQDTRGSICERCGHPNDPLGLIRPYVAGADGAIESVQLAALVLPLERYRDRLIEWFEGKQVRPHLRILLNRLFAEPLPEFPITYRSPWGLSLEKPGWDGAVYNVWAEMYPGHLYWTQRAHEGAIATGSVERLWSDGASDRYVQFIGFDNSFFYAVVHLAMGFAAQEIGLSAPAPAEIVTNQFYLLESSKFSSSQGHAIWGRDLLAEWSADPVRLYLCLTNPESQEANFTVREMEHTLGIALQIPFQRLHKAWKRLLESDRIRVEGGGEWESWGRAFRKQFETAYTPESFSLRLAAETFVTYLSLLASEMERSADSGECFSAVPLGLLALYSLPLVPDFAAGIAVHSGVVGELSWLEPIRQDESNLSPISSDLLTLRTRAPRNPNDGV